MKTKLFLFLMLVFLWEGCNNYDSGAQEGVRITMKGVSDHAALNGRTAESTGTDSAGVSSIVFSEALLGVRELEFKLVGDDNDDDGDGDDDHDHDNSGPDGGDRHDGDNDDGDNDEIKFEGQFVVDLIAGTSTPDFGVAEIVPGVYEKIEIKLIPILPDSNSVFIAFSFTKTDGDTFQVEFSTKKALKFEIEDDDGFQIDENVLNNILVLVDLDKLLAGIDLSQATVDANGVIKINDSSNTLILNHVLSNFNHSCHGGEDNNHDDDID